MRTGVWNVRTINKANSYFMRVLGEQSPEPGVEYAEHPYIIKDGNLWYNALTNEAVQLSESEDEESELIKRWFYVPEGMDVKPLSYLIRSKINYLESGPRVTKGTFVFFLTTACNAACTYCYEKGTEVDTMSEEVAEDAAEYICKNSGKDAVVKIRWFGGEPLLNKKAMNIITGILADNGVRYVSEMFSNGDLFDTVDDIEIERWNLQTVQFTLDDIGTRYDKIKGLPDGAYERLKRTIVRLRDMDVHSSLRIHLDPKKGIAPCKAVVDAFRDMEDVGMYARILYNQPLTEKNYDELLELEDYIRATGKFRRNFRSYNSAPYCMADTRATACITTDGHLSFCEHYPFGESYGSIYEPKYNAEKTKQWRIREKYERGCKQCVLYPTCKKLTMCPAVGKCTEGYAYYQIESIKRAMRERS